MHPMARSPALAVRYAERVARPRPPPNTFLVLMGVALGLIFFLFTRRGFRGIPRVSGPSPESSAHVELGTPRDADESDDVLLRRKQYVLSYNPKLHVANWASWRLRASDFGRAERHRGEFFEDSMLPPGILRITHRDYSRSGFDRGHLVRSADRTASRDDNDATFFMTNVVPQRHALNEGAWSALEQHCAELSRHRGKQLFIVAGPIFDGPPRVIGPGVRVPDALFKIVVVLEPGQGRRDVVAGTPVIAVRMPNRDDAGLAWETHRTTVDALEAATGYDFLDGVDPAVQAVVEAR